MRSGPVAGSTVAYFSNDLNGGYELQCQKCFHEDAYVGDDNPAYPQPWICKGCGTDMYYPPGAEW